MQTEQSRISHTFVYHLLVIHLISVIHYQPTPFPTISRCSVNFNYPLLGCPDARCTRYSRSTDTAICRRASPSLAHSSRIVADRAPPRWMSPGTSSATLVNVQYKTSTTNAVTRPDNGDFSRASIRVFSRAGAAHILLSYLRTTDT